MKSRDILVGVFALVLLAVVGYVWFAPGGMQQAPQVRLVTLQGNDITLDQLRGRPVLVTFWATTCPGCRKEMPHLVKLYRDLHPKGLEIVGIAMSYDPPNQVKNLVQQRAIPYTIALDITGEAARAFGDVRLTPTSFLIAPDGRIVKQKIGEMDMDEVRRLVGGMLAKGTAHAQGAA